MVNVLAAVLTVAPARERGLKCHAAAAAQEEKSRSREGAWIEIRNKDYKNLGLSVAPARERGLKSEFVGSSLKPGIVAPARERGLK